MTRPHLSGCGLFLLWVCGVADIDPPSPQPSPPRGRGEREPIGVYSEPEFDARLSGRRNSNIQHDRLRLALQKGEGEREPIGVYSEPEFDARLSGRCNSNIHLDRLPLPPGEGWGEGKAFYLLGCLACSSFAAARCFSSAGNIFCANAFSSGAPLTLSSVTVLACFLNSSMVSS